MIDTETRCVVATFNVGGYPVGVALSPDGASAYVADNDGDTVSVIDTRAELSQRPSISEGPRPE